MLRELAVRVAFQMSATDSSNLIDSPAASRLGVNRAILFLEEQGTMEKFRPYAPSSTEWLAFVRRRLRRDKEDVLKQHQADLDKWTVI